MNNDTTKLMKINDYKKLGFTISTDKDKLDISTVYQFLKSSYWANDRSLEQIENSIKNSLCFGMYGEKNQIGFARVITDYLCT